MIAIGAPEEAARSAKLTICRCGRHGRRELDLPALSKQNYARQQRQSGHNRRVLRSVQTLKFLPGAAHAASARDGRMRRSPRPSRAAAPPLKTASAHPSRRAQEGRPGVACVEKAPPTDSVACLAPWQIRQVNPMDHRSPDGRLMRVLRHPPIVHEAPGEIAPARSLSPRGRGLRSRTWLPWLEGGRARAGAGGRGGRGRAQVK